MRTLIVGANRLGRALAHELLADGHDVRVLDADEHVLARLPTALERRSLHGPPLDRDTLAGAMAGCDGLAAVTDDDAVNAVVALAARRELAAPIAVAVIGNPARAEALGGLGVHIRCPTMRTARDVHACLARSAAEEELVLGRNAGVYRVELPARMCGRSLADLGRAGALVPVAVERSGRIQLAEPGIVLQEGDVLHAASTQPNLITDLLEP
jgi:trk system potassium uptake protein TrkA